MHNLKDIARTRRAADADAHAPEFDDNSGVASRELFRARIDAQWEQCQAERLPLGVLLVKVNGLSECFSNHSAREAEECVAKVGSVISRACRRRADFAGRLRIDEFGVMLVESQPDGTHHVAQAIHNAVERLQLEHPDTDAQQTISVSIGGACTIPSMNRFANSLLITANRALQSALAEGPGTVECISDS